MSPVTVQAATLLAALMVLAPARARGEAAGAAELYRQGVEAFEEGNYDDAASLFRLSYEMDSRAATMCNLALAYDRWEDHEQQALEAYRRCAEEDAEGRFRDHALERSAVLRRQLEARGGGAGEGGTSAPPDTTEPEGGGLSGSGGEGAGSDSGQGGEGPSGEPPRRGRRRGLVIDRPLLWAGVGTGAVALASFATAIGLHVWTAGIHDDLDSEYGDQPIPPESAAADRLGRGETGVGAALGLYIVGGVLAALAAVLVVIDLTQASNPVEATFVSAAPTPGGFVVAASLGFD